MSPESGEATLSAEQANMMELSSAPSQAFQRIVADGSSRVHMGNVFNYAVTAEGKYEDCLRSLFLTNPLDDLAAIRRSKGSRVEGTCEWILTHDKYLLWRNEYPRRLLRLVGSPGIGKSMLASFLVDEIEKSTSQAPGTRLLYYFCDNKDEKRNTALSIVRTVLWQLLRLEPALFRHIQPDFEQTTDLRISFDALWRIFLDAIEESKFDELYILIDALDECDASSRQVFMDNLKEAVIKWESSDFSVKVLLTSRPEVDIEEAFDQALGCDSLRVDSGKINSDLMAFISAKVADVVRRKHWPSKWTDKIGSALSAQSGGTFLWASLVLDDISRVKTTKMIEGKLANLPSDLTQVYDRILQSIGEEYVETAKYILQWVVVAQRPLTVTELAMAQALNPVDFEGRNIPSVDEVEDCEDGYKSCIPFVERDPKNDTINLIHQSAKDYLTSSTLSKSETLSHYYVDPDRAQVLASETCCRFLCCEELDGLALQMDDKMDRGTRGWWTESLSPLPERFLRYAATSWDDHCTLIPESILGTFGYFEELFTLRPSLYSSWLKAAVYSGQESTVRLLLTRFPNAVDLKDQNGKTALFFSRNVAMTKLLLDNGASATMTSKSRETALHRAVSNGHEDIIQVLLVYGANIDATTTVGETPLYQARESAIVRLLIEKGANVKATTKNVETALHRIRNAEVVQELIDHGAEVDAKNDWGWTAFHKAACENHGAVCNVLLKNGADINARGNNGQTALARVSRYGYQPMAQNLLDEGADPNILDRMGHTALDMAEELKRYRNPRGSADPLTEPLIELLLSKGAKRGRELPENHSSDSTNKKISLADTAILKAAEANLESANGLGEELHTHSLPDVVDLVMGNEQAVVTPEALQNRQE